MKKPKAQKKKKKKIEQNVQLRVQYNKTVPQPAIYGAVGWALI